MIKNCIFILFVLFFSACSLKFDGSFWKSPNDDMKNEINHIIKLMKENDLENLNKRYLNKDFGFYQVRYNKEKSLIIEKSDFLDEIDRFVKPFDIQSKEVQFNCSYDLDLNYGWNEEGVFVLRKDIKYLKNYEVNKKEEQKFIKHIINNSYEVVTLSQMIFYITKYEDKIYIVLIDNARTDCRK
ncbi:hypothetical protein AAX26_00193 [Aliarcobacter thereius]|uniref:Lipoprotein n=2 Tax=Aliarcobacter thereius TaxID=544718 RepID=A0A1C0B9T2_9BACT|nr:hypothetical protein [Aliarcobacter thereius]OCL88512.1 hypothetical protein AAX26_00193 [Aliarcobacter thereius]OCL92002.1 hypothetical protein AAX25_00727 [Aliarcobacter thereius]OCL94900.1 hypothetical protein AA347_00346 [Aliarcobacter thereius LMG 24486]OCM00348.1 hypothetical protein AAX29_00351 [Aliarcobacter thereius]QBF15228.1 hypothetical protein ATH_0131 [Aliarcobacter thereius LMG 24486]